MKVKEINPTHLEALEAATMVVEQPGEFFSVKLDNVTEDDCIWSAEELEAFVAAELDKKDISYDSIEAGQSQLGLTFTTVTRFSY